MDISTKYRTTAPEIMDDFSMEGETLREALDKIADINSLLGGNSVTLDGVRKLIASQSAQTTISIVDIGCGNGDMLRHLAAFAQKNNLDFHLVGFDANAFTVGHAESLSGNYPNIRYECLDIFNESFKHKKYDIALCTLTLHHFDDQEIHAILETLYQNCTLGMVINDLQRSKVAYRLFKLLSRVWQLNAMSREDGLVSILRGFKKKELEQFSKTSNFKKYSIRWKWAFRYQWIIYKQ